MRTPENSGCTIVRGHDAVLVHQPAGKGRRLQPVHAQQPDRAAVIRAKRSRHAHAIAACQQRAGPAVAQVTQTRGLALHADAAMKGHRHRHGIEHRLRMRADLLVLAHVGGARLVRPINGHSTGIRSRRTYRKPEPIGACSHLCSEVAQ
jgi:hypothetical protein